MSDRPYRSDLYRTVHAAMISRAHNAIEEQTRGIVRHHVYSVDTGAVSGVYNLAQLGVANEVPRRYWIDPNDPKPTFPRIGSHYQGVLRQVIRHERARGPV